MGRPFIKKVKMAKQQKKKIKIIAPVTCKFGLPASVGDVVSYNKNLADQLVEDKYAEFVK